MVSGIAPWPCDVPKPQRSPLPWQHMQQVFSAAASSIFSGLTKLQSENPSEMKEIKQLHYDNIIQEKLLGILSWLRTGIKGRIIRNLKPYLLESKLEKFWKHVFGQPLPPICSLLDIDLALKRVHTLRVTLRLSNQPQQLLKATYSKTQQTYNRLRAGSDFLKWQCNARKPRHRIISLKNPSGRITRGNECTQEVAAMDAQICPSLIGGPSA